RRMTARSLNWIGGEHQVALNIGELRALQEVCNAGPEEVFNRLRRGDWRIDDLIEVLRLGLIGGGAMTAEAAGVFVTGLMAKHPLVAFKLPAIEILARALLGVGDDPVGKLEGGDQSPPANGASAASTETGR
ncbi:gene transfer agent family protein, partial [Thioclava sp. BHET1]